MLPVRDVAAQRPVVELRLEHDDRIRVADGGGEEPLRVGRSGRNRHLHAGRVDVVGLGRVVVELRRAHPAAVGHPDHERKGHLPAGTPAVAAHVRDELIEARVRERVVLHLADGPEPRHAEPDRGAEDASLGERRVHAAVGTEAVAEPCRGAEDPSRPTHVLTHDEHRGIPLELDVEAVVDRLDDRELSHGVPSSLATVCC